MKYWRAGALKAAVAILATTVFAGAGTAQAAGYSFTTLSPPGVSAGDWSRAVAINNLGQVVVQVEQPNVSYDFAKANSIYDSHTGTYAGLTDNPLGEAGGTQFVGLNRHGQAVGFYHPTGKTWQGFRYSGGTFTDLNIGGAPLNLPEGINDRGVIVGVMDNGLGIQGYLYSGGQLVVHNLAKFPRFSTALLGINNAGHFIGLTGPTGLAFDQSFIMVNGVATPISLASETLTVASGVNDYDVVVGGASSDGFRSGPGFIYDKGVATAFGVPGAVETFAYGINNRGQIVGQYFDEFGVGYAFLANPLLNAVPEPASWGLMLFGLSALGLRLRSRKAKCAV